MPTRKIALAAVLAACGLAAPAEAARLYAVDASRQLVAFNAHAPASLLSAKPISGLAQPAVEEVKGLDVRPSTGEAILLTTATFDRIYRLDLATGVASDPLTLSPGIPNGVAYGVAIDPVEDELRLTGADLSNRTVDLVTGQVTTHTATDGPYDALAYQPDGDVFAYASDAGGGEDGLGSRSAAFDEDAGVFGPLSATSFDPDDSAANAAMTAVGNTLLLTARGFGLQRLVALPLGGGDATELGTVGDGGSALRAMTSVEGVARLVGGTSAEEGATATLVVARDAARAPSTVSWTAQPGTAAAGTDFAATSGTLSFGEGQGAATIAIPLPEEAAIEGTETFTVTLTSATGGTALAGTRTATVTVVDVPPTPAAERILVPFPVGPPARVLAAGACTNPTPGTAGDDALVGTAAGDSIFGGAGADALVGRDGDDCLVGGPGNDWLNGANGRDVLGGESGEDVLLGGRGNDALNGGAGDDRIAGGEGADTISAGSGSNHIVGGSGNDRINARNGRRDVIDCGGGRDRASIDIRRDKTRACETIPGT